MRETNTNCTGRSEGQSSGTANKLMFLLIGGGIGATIALLFAPKDGSAFRGDLARAGRQGLDLTREKAGQLKEQSAEVVQGLKEKASAAYDMAASKLGSAGGDADNIGASPASRASDAIDRPDSAELQGRKPPVF